MNLFSLSISEKNPTLQWGQFHQDFWATFTTQCAKDSGPHKSTYICMQLRVRSCGPQQACACACRIYASPSSLLKIVHYFLNFMSEESSQP